MPRSQSNQFVPRMRAAAIDLRAHCRRPTAADRLQRRYPARCDNQRVRRLRGSGALRFVAARRQLAIDRTSTGIVQSFLHGPADSTLMDALIIGGGPAGSTAALLLAKAGWSVGLVEKSRFPRRKVCGEFLSATNLPLLRHLGVADSFRKWAGP